jgi:hypothetical protein
MANRVSTQLWVCEVETDVDGDREDRYLPVARVLNLALVDKWIKGYGEPGKSYLAVRTIGAAKCVKESTTRSVHECTKP